jgi:branched-chain amino acid transport system permease protein
MRKRGLRKKSGRAAPSGGLSLDTAFLLQLLVNGLALGVIYALIALGLSLIFGVIEIVNFAHGEFYMLGAMLAFFLASDWSLGYWPIILIVTLALAGLGYLFYETLLVQLRGKSFERNIMLTLGVSMVMQSGAMYLWSATPRLVPSPYTYVNITAGDIRIGLLKVFVCGLAAVSFVALYVMLHTTRLGKAMRGIAQNRDAALMVGINPAAIARYAVAIGIGLTGLAGAALAPVYAVHPVMGLPYMFKAFAVIIIGGLGNIGGAAIIAILLGLIESIAGGFLPLGVVDSLAFIFMTAVLLARPRGLFGRSVRV